jgi:lipoyl(octanoyl) transferase
VGTEIAFSFIEEFMLKWRIVVSDKLSSAGNMAVDEAILNGVIAGTSPPTIRFYDWLLPTASYGYNQSWEKEIDLDLVKKNNFDYVRRPTGGRLVLHFDEVTYAVIAPAEDQLSGNVIQSYSEISRALKGGFMLMGLEVDLERGELSAQHQRENLNPCFTSSSRYELKFKGKKIAGSAQVRKKNTILQHGSILLNHDQSKVADILPGLDSEQRKRVGKFLTRKSTAINRILPQKLSFLQAAEYLKNGFKTAWDTDQFNEKDVFMAHEINEVEQLISEKYSSDLWNKRK